MFDKTYPVLRLDGDETVTTKCLLIATGVAYRRLNAERCEQFEGRGVFYAATHNEAQLCKGAQVVLVGGSNSAGQAAVLLSQHAGDVRSDSVKRVASAVGEGAMAVQFVHEYLKEV